MRVQRSVARSTHVTLLGLAVGLALLAAAPLPAAAQPLECNGSAELCARSIGDVAIPTSHNSMSSSADGFLGPNQGATIEQQLANGIRGFQIDSYPGVARGSRVYTDLDALVAKREIDLPRPLRAAAQQLHRQLGRPPEGTPTEVYLCHVFCEIGATPMRDFADDIKAFLDANPDEVIAIVLEDYVPPEEMAAVFDEAGLTPSMLAVEPGAALPTLGEMIQSGKRLFVTLENGDGGPTLRNAFDGLVHETPYNFPRGRELRGPRSCRDHRGVSGSPVFQLNHWVTPARGRGAESVNSELLRDRARLCQEVRKQLPTLVAVDFAETGDVIEVADELNRQPADAR